MVGALVREDDKRVYGDAGCTGMWKHIDEEKGAPHSKCCVVAKRGAIKKMDESPMKTLLLAIEKAEASIRAKVEHSFHDQESLRLPKGALKGLGQESCATFQPVRAGQPGGHDVRAKLMGPVRLESGLVAG